MALPYVLRKFTEITNMSTQVDQTVSTGNNEYPVLFTETANKTNSSNEGTRFAKNVTVNPSTGTVTAAKFSGEVSNSGYDFSATFKVAAGMS